MAENEKKMRVMWLLNHKSAMAFEIPALKKNGVSEIFLPKIIPDDPTFRSASISYEEDKNLTIPNELLKSLNGINWYRDRVSPELWEEINKYFDVIFFILYDYFCLEQFLLNFKGALVLRAYGLPFGLTYSGLINERCNLKITELISKRGNFFFGQAYDNLAEIEEDYLKNKALYLPLGLPPKKKSMVNKGGSGKLLFVLPDIRMVPDHQENYKMFSETFKDIPRWIGGSQILEHKGSEVLGYLSDEEYRKVMETSEVMFYHSNQPRHLFYHPLEAMEIGLPVIFLSGGMLDNIGGGSLPGRAKNYKEAKVKIQRILSGDKSFRENCIQSQQIILKKLTLDYCLPYWKKSFLSIKAQIAEKEPEVNPKVGLLRSHADIYRRRDYLEKNYKENSNDPLITFHEAEGTNGFCELSLNTFIIDSLGNEVEKRITKFLTGSNDFQYSGKFLINNGDNFSNFSKIVFLSPLPVILSSIYYYEVLVEDLSFAYLNKFSGVPKEYVIKYNAFIRNASIIKVPNKLIKDFVVDLCNADERRVFVCPELFVPREGCVNPEKWVSNNPFEVETIYFPDTLTDSECFSLIKFHKIKDGVLPAKVKKFTITFNKTSQKTTFFDLKNEIVVFPFIVHNHLDLIFTLLDSGCQVYTVGRKLFESVVQGHTFKSRLLWMD